jgi:hypothetical protein
MALKAITILSVFLGVFYTPFAYGQTRTFTLENAIVGMHDIQAFKGEIPSEITSPLTMSVSRAYSRLNADTALFVVPDSKQTRGYVLGLLAYRSIVNLGGTVQAMHALVWDNASGVGLVWRPEVETSVKLMRPPEEFFKTTALYKGTPILTDNLSHSAWVPALGKAVGGPRVGERLPSRPFYITSLSNLYAASPDADIVLPTNRERKGGDITDISLNDLAQSKDPLCYVFTLTEGDKQIVLATQVLYPTGKVPTTISVQTALGAVSVRVRSLPLGAVDVSARQGVNVQQAVMRQSFVQRLYPKAVTVPIP